MAYPALKRVSYFGQFGILAGFVGAGLVVAGVISIFPFLTQPGLQGVLGKGKEEIMDKLLVPENAGILRVVQFISTFFLFFLPTWAYAKVCHKKSMTHLGFRNHVSMGQFLVVIAIMFFSLPLVSMLGQLTEMLPFSAATMQKFKQAEEEYVRQVSIIGRMNNVGDYIISLFMLAILPAVFEETLFRGGVQNLLSRWFKMPILAIVITSVIFSAVHFSYLGFLSRVALSFVLGWMYYRTGNLWLNIIGHVTNNAAALTVLYVTKLNKPNVKLETADPEFPFWLGFLSLGTVILLFYAFEKVSKYQVNQPGKEILMPDPMADPFAT